MEFWWIYLLIGATAGVLGSMLGVGGGVLMVPAMLWFCGIKQTQVAAALSLAVMIPMATSSTIQNMLRDGLRPEMAARWIPVLLMAAAAIAGTFLGGKLANEYLSGTALKKIFAVLMVVVAIKIFLEKEPAKAVNASGGQTVTAGSGQAGPANEKG